jgi:hypothetical protein
MRVLNFGELLNEFEDPIDSQLELATQKVPLHEPGETFQQLERVLSREGIYDFLRFAEPLKTQENETHVNQSLAVLDEAVEKGDQTLQVTF